MTDLTGNIVLGANQYGKAENRVVRIYRDTARHEIRDISVSSALRGDFSAAHLVGDQGAVLPTDTQKQTAYAYAKEKGLLHLESYGLDLARHFVDDVEPVTEARIELEEYAWERVTVDGRPHDHTWVRKGQETRVASVTVAGTGSEQKTWVTAGFKDLIILKSTGSEFAGFLEDSYTVLAPTHDRVMATSLEARWRYTTTDVDWDEVYAGVKAVMIEQFATLQSLALQQTLFAMGRAALEAFPFIAELRMSAPNKHHFLYDLDRFGVENNGEVFHADDRPYGLIQATVEREDAPDAGSAWRGYSVVG
ncbi:MULTISPECIES: factor-independent urate hydroxylase [unclassified Rhodococcus (in: high G+C Gram-positive bacteria)]|jgi:urate oxidase|uniref:factor-independent urate hydroxylase n=1 Tax=unclassified Rhodococcus (in: high G+C Gram-positive bacteria) TaxID=192944 RepID=UPI0006F8C426|nr:MULTISPECIES: urate oxidase [unclassified Rhodococcus (in: high G+C Gram-positive bacteria)]KQU31197.1 urate oxidase [Rhodococcus sp. Leaf225]KQU41451.1 urate oxidase [Rhodococcus sp. Leaf258]